MTNYDRYKNSVTQGKFEKKKKKLSTISADPFFFFRLLNLLLVIIFAIFESFVLSNFSRNGVVSFSHSVALISFVEPFFYLDWAHAGVHGVVGEFFWVWGEDLEI